MGDKEDGSQQTDDSKQRPQLIGGAPEQRALHRAHEPRKLDDLGAMEEAQRRRVEQRADQIQRQCRDDVEREPAAGVLAHRSDVRFERFVG